MPIVKTCPRCGATHKKRGPYCSRSCGNVREHTEEDKRIRREKLIEYHQTPEAVATRAKASAAFTAMNRGEEYTAVSQEDYAVDIPDIKDQNLIDDWFEGFDKGEKW